MLPYFNRLEDDLDFGDAPYHGKGGPIPVYRAPLERWGAVDKALRAAALDLGYGWNPDHNAPFGTGVSPYAINSRDLQRVSTNDAYLEPARDRPNLTIVGDAHVDRVLFDVAEGGARRACGFASAASGLSCAGARSSSSAGSVYTPPILLRSGVGPADELRDLGMAVCARFAGRAQPGRSPDRRCRADAAPGGALADAARAPHQLHRPL